MIQTRYEMKVKKVNWFTFIHENKNRNEKNEILFSLQTIKGRERLFFDVIEEIFTNFC